MMITNIAVIEDNFDFESYGTSPSFPVPDRLAEDVIRTDLSQVMDKVLGEEIRKDIIKREEYNY